MCMQICINLWELPGLQWSHPWLLFLVLNLLVLNLPSLDSAHIFTQMTKRCQGGLQPPLEVTFQKKTKKEKIISRWKKKLFKITGIIPWGQSKLVMTMNGVLGCFYGVLETLFFSFLKDKYAGYLRTEVILGLAHLLRSIIKLESLVV